MPGRQQRGEHGVFEHFGHRADPVPIGISAEAVVEAGALQPVAMRHFDGINLCPIECAGDLAHVIEAILVADGVHPVAQGHVLNIELGGGGIEVHAAILSAIFSAGLERGRGHDIEIAGISGQIMRRAFHFEEDRDLEARITAAHLGNAQRLVAADAFETAPPA